MNKKRLFVWVDIVWTIFDDKIKWITNWSILKWYNVFLEGVFFVEGKKKEREKIIECFKVITNKKVKERQSKKCEFKKSKYFDVKMVSNRRKRKKNVWGQKFNGLKWEEKEDEDEKVKSWLKISFAHQKILPEKL